MTQEATQLYTEQRPWGQFTVLMDADYCKVKELVVNPGQRLSLQMHHQREEHWVVVEGTAEVTLGEETLVKPAGSHIHIGKETKHRLANPATEGVVRLVEVQLGSYFGEDDIVRFVDDYQRV